MDLHGLTALVTGASSGLGLCFADELAAKGANLVTTARRGERLEKIAKELMEKYSIQVTILPLDLAKPGSVQTLIEQTEGRGLAIDILINNAGVASFGPFLETEWQRLEEQLRLNVFSLAELTYRLTSKMRERKRGYVLNIASSVAFLPVPHYALYAATKSFVLSFTSALAFETRKSHVRVCCLCPGSMATEFWEVAGHKNLPFLIRAARSKPEKVARLGLKSLIRGRPNKVAGLANKLMVFFTRLTPRRVLIVAASWVAGRGLEKKSLEPKEKQK